MEIEKEKILQTREQLSFGNSAGTQSKPGIVWENHKYQTQYKTIVVLGLMHSGTSALAAMLYGLGVDFGTTNVNNFEEIEIKIALRSKDQETISSAIDNHNQQSDIWGFKLPRVFDVCAPQDLHSHLRNPFYFLIVRDVAATSQFLPNVSPSCAIIRRLQRKQSELDQLLYQSLEIPKAPKMLVSYQRLLQQPEKFCQQVIQFLRIKPTQEQMLRAIVNLSPKGGYLMSPPDTFGWQRKKLG